MPRRHVAADHHELVVDGAVGDSLRNEIEGQILNFPQREGVNLLNAKGDDNALLVITYAEAFQITGNILYRGIAEKTLGYVDREMTSPEDGFYSAQDADSEGETSMK